jgi:radical S-adenosyl methionine domain-containing protein 2
LSYPADWRVTSRCTLACDFCYGPVPAQDPAHLRSAIARRLVESSADVVTFCGGEPLMVPEIGQYAAEMQQAGKLTVLNTNGQLLRHRIEHGMPLAFNIVGLSLDGSTEAMHREMRGERADFDAVLDAAKFVRSRHAVTLKLATVVSSVNRHDVVRMAALVQALHADIWRLYQYVPIGAYNRGQQRHTLPETEFLQIAEAARAAAAPLPVFASTADTQGPGCLLISMDGTVFHAGPERDIVHGNCLRTPLDEIWSRIGSSHPGEVVLRNKGWHELVLHGPGLNQRRPWDEASA